MGDVVSLAPTFSTKIKQSVKTWFGLCGFSGIPRSETNFSWLKKQRRTRFRCRLMFRKYKKARTHEHTFGLLVFSRFPPFWNYFGYFFNSKWWWRSRGVIAQGVPRTGMVLMFAPSPFASSLKSLHGYQHGVCLSHGPSPSRALETVRSFRCVLC